MCFPAESREGHHQVLWKRDESEKKHKRGNCCTEEGIFLWSIHVNVWKEPLVHVEAMGKVWRHLLLRSIKCYGSVTRVRRNIKEAIAVGHVEDETTEKLFPFVNSRVHHGMEEKEEAD